MHERCIYGPHAIGEWLRAAPKRLHVVHYDRQSAAQLAVLIEMATTAGVPLRPSDPQTLTALAGTARHQGVVAPVAPFPYAELDRLIERMPRLLVMADQMQDPHNLGALLRTAEAAGAGGVIIPKDGSVAITATVEAGAAGAAALVPVCRVTNAVRTLQTLKERGYWSIGLIPRHGTDLYQIEYPDRVVVVVGGETGMRPLVVKHCDFVTSIPMFGQVESLNASVAAAIVLYELRRRWGPP